MTQAERRPTLVIIDGHSLLYRGFYATRPLTTSDGTPTNAVYAFTNMLLSLLERVQPDAIVVAFDAPAPTFRHEAFTEYKAHRRETPEAFRPQVEMTRRLLEAMGVPTLSEEGFEADDLVGALARYAVEQGYDALIFTGDRDQLQLINPHVRVCAPQRGVSELEIFDADAVQQKYGLTPAQIVDFKALAGDASDNIPGVPGVGEKTAVKLLQQFGSVENLLANLEQVESEKLREALRQHADQIRQSRMLATILDNAPLSINHIPRFALTPERVQALHRVLESYEFRSILKRLPALIEKFGGAPTAVESVYETLRPEVIRNPDEATLARLLEGDAPVGMRLYGALNHLRDATLDAVALAVSPDRAVWLELGGSLFLPEPLTRLLNDPSRPRVVWDLKTECLLLRGAGVEAHPADFDALLAAYLWQPSRASYTLDWLCEDVLRLRLPDDEARPAAEACALRMLQPRLRAILEREETLRVLEQIEQPLAPILAEMEWHGVRLDAPYLQELSVRLEAEMNHVARDIYTLAGEEFNIGSPKQLGAILFEKLGLPIVKKTKTGYSTDAEVLQTLAAEHPIAALIVKYRELSKLRSTYADALPRLINPLTGRIHTKLNQTVTATGRLSSSEPNLQNIPIRTEIGREIRRAFIADPNYLLLSLDYSQIELRILAHMSGDPALMQAFERGEDIHTATASILFGVPPEQVDTELRRRAKTVNYAVLYGMSDYGLSQELGIGVGEAKQIIEQYFQRFPHIKAFTQSILEEARAKGYVRTLLGRKRDIPELHSANRNERLAAERAAINMPFQGTAADIMKLAMIRVHRRLPALEPAARMLLQVHDELLLESPDSRARVAAVAEAVRAEMEAAYPLHVPLTVDAKVGANWRDMEAI
ncbi:MAG: DNA polymerase I [Fimbriimonadales bacterium]|nr:MAG: DNA polymerase [Fimbriimonadales bacterium]